MLYYLAPILTEFWGPFRLFGSYMVLMGLGATAAALLVWRLLPRTCHLLTCDRGRLHTPTPQAAHGKPTGAGVIVVVLLLPILLLVVPFSPRFWGIIACLVLAMLTGFFDDFSAEPWGELKKGLLDLGVAFLTSLIITQGRPMTVWLPLLKGSYEVSPVIYIALATALLWLCINATNCSDGIDGLAGSLTLLSVFYLGGFLYIVIGHNDIASYLLVPHNPAGATWAVLLFTSAGALAGYLWHNAEPSRLLMGDAGSRFLGLLVGVAVLATGNPFLVLVVAPVVLVNGGTGLVKVVLLRGFKKLGFDVRPPARKDAPDSGTEKNGRSHFVIHLLHRVRFPLHDHCRSNLGWSNPQVLLRFVLLQAFITPLLLGIFVKLR